MRYVGSGLQQRNLGSVQGNDTVCLEHACLSVTSLPPFPGWTLLTHLFHVSSAVCVSGPLLCTGDAVVKWGRLTPPVVHF